MDAMVLGFDNLRGKYPEEKYMLILPVASKHILGHRTDWSIDVTTVKIDPDDKNYVYSAKDELNKKTDKWEMVEAGLTKVALDLICAAADVDVDVVREDDRSDRLYASYKATATMATPSGKTRTRTATVDWEGDVMEEKHQLKAEQYVRKAVAGKWRGASTIGIPWANLTEGQIQECIDIQFKQRWIDEREFGKRKTLSKAARNAVKALLAMPGTFPPQLLRDKEFAIAKLVFTPDMSDPQIRQMMIANGQKAAGLLYGGAVNPEGKTAAVGLLPAATHQTQAQPAADDQVFESAVEEDPEWTAAKKLAPEIERILGSWSGAEKTRDQLADRYKKAADAKDAKTITNIHEFCSNAELDAALAAEDGQGEENA